MLIPLPSKKNKVLGERGGSGAGQKLKYKTDAALIKTFEAIY